MFLSHCNEMISILYPQELLICICVIRQWHVKNAVIFERYLGVQFVKTVVYRCLTGKTPKAII